MKNLLFFDLLSETLSKPEQKQLISVMETDQYFRDWLVNGGFKKYFCKLGNNFANTELVDFSLVSLDLNRELINLSPKDKEYLPKAVKYYEEIRNNRKKLHDFKEAGLVSLALFERWRRIKSWQGLFKEIIITQQNIPAWKSILSLLFCTAGYDESLLDEINENLQPSISIQINFHVINNQLIPQSIKSELIQRLYLNSDKSIRVSWLQFLLLKSPEIAKQIVEPNKNLFSGLENQIPESFQDLKMATEYFLDSMLSGYTYLIHNSPHLAIHSFEHAEKLSRRLLSDLGILKMVYSEGLVDDEYLKLSVKENQYLSDIFLSRKNETSEVNEFNQGIISQLETLLDLFQSGERPRAVELAKIEFDEWLNGLSRRGEDFETILYLSGLEVSNFVALLEKLGLQNEINLLLDLLGKYTDDQPEVKKFIYSYYEKNGAQEKIYQMTKQSLMENPDQKELHYALIKLLENGQFWGSAVKEWKIFADTFQLSTDEWLDYSKTACKANNLRDAQDILDKLNLLEEDSRKLSGLKGQIAFLEGRLDQAKEYLKGAVKHFPEDAESWLLLSKIYVSEGDEENAFSSLKSGIFASPDCSDLHFYLAILHLDRQSYSEAVKNLKNAVSLNPYNPDLYFPLIDTLQIVGLWDEGLKYLSFARKQWPSERNFAFLDAKQKLSEGNKKEAIKLLKIATDGESDQIPDTWFLLLIDTILKNDKEEWILSNAYSISQENLLLSQKTLQNLLTKDSEDEKLPIKVWLAEIYYLLGESELSLNLFEEAFKQIKENIDGYDFAWRIFAGLGVLRSDQTRFDEALILLAQASKMKPENLGIKRNLAENYYAANLTEEALKISNEILQNKKEDLLTILWYAEFMSLLNRPQERIIALELALQFKYHKPVINTQLAEEYISAGRENDAVTVLEEILNLSEVQFQDLRSAVTSFLRVDKKEHALRFYEQGISLMNGLDLESLTELIYLHYINQNWEDLVDVFARVEVDITEYAIYYVIKGFVYKNLGKIEASIEAFELAMGKKVGISERLIVQSLNPIFIPEKWLSDFENIQEINFDLVGLWMAQGDHIKAINHLNAIKETSQMNKRSWFSLVELYIQTNHINDALDCLRQMKRTTALTQLDQELYRAYEVFLTYLVKEKPRPSEFVAYQNEGLGQIIDGFVFAQDNQYLYAKKQFDYVKKSLDFEYLMPDQTAKVDFISEYYITMRLLLFTAYALYDYSFLDYFITLMSKVNAFDYELPYYQVIFNLQNQVSETVFTKLNVVKIKSEVLYPLNGNHAVDLTLTPITEKLFDSTLKKSLLAFLSTYETSSKEELLVFLKYKIPGISAFVLSELINRGEVLLVKNYMKQNEELSENILFALSLMESDVLESKLSLDRLPDFEHPIFLYLRGLINLKNNLNDVGILEINKAIALMPEQIYWSHNLATILLENDYFEEAKRLWKELLSKELPIDKKEILLPYITLLIETNSLNEAEKLFDIYKQILSDDLAVYSLQCKLYYNLKNFNKVLEICSRADRIFKDDIEILWWKAKACFQLGDFSRAAVFAQEFIYHNPVNIEGNYLYIEALINQGFEEEALNHINQMLAKSDETTDLSLLKLSLLVKLGKFDEAIHYSSLLKDVFYDNPDFNAKLAELYFRIGDFHSAEHSARAVIRNNDYDYPEVRILLAKILENQGKLDQSLQYLGQAAQKSGKDPRPYLEMGRIYYRMRDFQKSLTAYQEAIKLNSEDPSAYYEAGLIMREIKDYLGAEKMLRIASELNPKDANIRKQLAGVIALNFVHTTAEAE